MRNLARFLFLFGAGLVLLLVLDWKQSDELLGDEGNWGRRSVPTSAPRARSGETAEQRGRNTPVPDSPGLRGQPGAPQISDGKVILDGELDYTRYGAANDGGTRPRVYHVHAEDVDHLERDTYLLHDLEAEVYDEASGGVRLQLQAVEGTARISEGRRAGEGYSVGEGGPVTLEVMHARWLGDVLSPTTLQADHMEGNLSEGEWIATGDVVLKAPGLTATGHGLRLSQRENIAVFAENGRLVAEEAGKPRTVLVSSGPLILARSQVVVPAGAGAETDQQETVGEFRVDGSGGCRLELAGGAFLEADEVHLEGRSRPTAPIADNTGSDETDAANADTPETNEKTSGLALTAARASGSVRLRQGRDLFTGDEAVIALGADGTPQAGQLIARPGSRVTGRIPLDRPARGGAGTEEETGGAARTLLMEGGGPLTVQFSPHRPNQIGVDPEGSGSVPTGFRLLGPARLVLMSETGESQAGAGALEAAGLVEGRREEDGTLFLRTSDMTHLKGTAAEGRPYTLDATDGLEAFGAGEAFRLLRAGGITLRLLGEDPLMARAEELRDFDSVAGTFTASGSVELTAVGWIVTAEQVARKGPRDLILSGSQDTLAHYVNRKPEAGEKTSLLEMRGRWIEIHENAAQAQGDVSVRLWLPATRGHVSIRGDRFTVREDGTGFLESDGEPVVASGRFGGGGIPWEVTGERIDFGPEHFEVIGADITWGEAPVGVRGRASTTLLRARARLLQANGARLVLSGDAHISGTQEDGSPWDLSAGYLRLLPYDPEIEGAPPIPFEPGLRRLEATEGFDLCLGERLSASGINLVLTGDRLRAGGTPLLLTGEGMQLETPWVEVNFSTWLLSTGRATVRGGLDTEAAWSLTYEALAPAGTSTDEANNEAVLALREPVHRGPERTLRGSWFLLWLDGPAWRARGQRLFGRDVGIPEPLEPRPTQERPPTPFLGNVDFSSASTLVQSIYAEGDLEILEGPVRRARADRMHLDLRHGGGWLDGADLILEVNVRGQKERLRTRARHMIHAPDGSLHADSATITSCSQDQAHYVIETGDLTVIPAAVGRGEGGAGNDPGWKIAARDNVLRLPFGPALPLPPLVYAADEEGNPIIENIILSNSARFGTALGATFNREVGSISRAVARTFGAPMEDLDGHWRYRASWLGSRGLLLGTGLRLQAPGVFEFSIDMDGIDDRRQDRGLVRVKKEERDSFRSWTRGRGRWTLGESSWVDLVFSSQTDAGVQAEFFQNQYLAFEERETYLHGRWADGYLYGSARARIATDGWRSEVEELPTAGLSAGRTPVATWGSSQLLWSADLDAGLFRRRQGDKRYELLFDDGPLTVEGDPRVGRLDHVQRLEMPLDLGFAGLKVIPRVEGRISAWDRGVDESTAPRRLTTIGGVDLATTFTRRFGTGTVHQISPRLGLTHTFSWDRSGGTPVPMDAMEDDPRGTALEFSLVTRMFRPGASQHFDLDLRGAFGEETPRAARRWLPLSALIEWRGELFGAPVGLVHDGIYDGEDGQTDYSRTEFGLRLTNGLGLEFGYRSAREESGARFYEAATAAARYRATPLWEVEIRETYSLQDELALHEKLTLRRLGHDFLFEIGIGNRRGEGGTTLSFTVEPLLGWRRGSLGLLDRWHMGSW